MNYSWNYRKSSCNVQENKNIRGGYFKMIAGMNELEYQALLETTRKRVMEEMRKDVPQEELDKLTMTVDEFLEAIDKGEL